MPYQVAAQQTYPTVDQGTYLAGVDAIVVEDHIKTPDKFGNTGFYTFIFKWRLEGVLSEDDKPIIIPQYVRLETGDRPITKGPRAGRLPLMTEITRAFGEPDLQPADEVDEALWVGKRAKLGVLNTPDAAGVAKNSINSVSVAPPRAKKNKPAPVIVEDDDPESPEPF